MLSFQNFPDRIRLACFIAALSVATTVAAPSSAMVGGAANAEAGLSNSVVTIIGSRASFCSGALIAPGLVLTAAHCVAAKADYKLVTYDANRQPRLIDVRRVITHPDFSAHNIANHRVTADVALMQTADRNALPAAPLPIFAPTRPMSAGQTFTVAGVGVAQPGDGRSGGKVRTATLKATGRPGSLQIRLVDPATNNTRAGLGACTGDSGGPVFQRQRGHDMVIGVISWSTGPKNSAGCGGLTGVTPLSLYLDWIRQTARQWGAPLP